MPEIEDLRGQTLRWRYVSGFPLDVRVLRNEVEVGRLAKKTNLRSEVDVRIGGVDWQVRPTPGDRQPSYEINFTGGKATYGKAAFSGGLLGDFEATIDGLRRYRRVALSDKTIAWQLANRTELTRDGWESTPKEGLIVVDSRCEPLDAAPLVALGLVLAMESHFFPNLD